MPNTRLPERTLNQLRFVVEAKWESAKADTGHIAKLQKRVRQRLVGTYGVFLSMSGYSAEALADVSDGERLEILLLDSSHWEAMLGGLLPPQELFALVHDRAAFHGEPYTPLVQLFPTVAASKATIGPPSDLVADPESEVILSVEESNQLGIAPDGERTLLIVTQDGILNLDLDRKHLTVRVPVPGCHRNPVALEDGSVVFARKGGVGRFHDGTVTTIGGGFTGNTCLARHPDGSIWVLDNGGVLDRSASVVRLGSELGQQHPHELGWPSSTATSASWLSPTELATVGGSELLISSATGATRWRLQLPQSNLMGLVTPTPTTVLTTGDGVTVALTDLNTRLSRIVGRLALRPSVSELVLAPDGTTAYVAAYQEMAGRRQSFAVVRLGISARPAPSPPLPTPPRDGSQQPDGSREASPAEPPLNAMSGPSTDRWQSADRRPTHPPTPVNDLDRHAGTHLQERRRRSVGRLVNMRPALDALGSAVVGVAFFALLLALSVWLVTTIMGEYSGGELVVSIVLQVWAAAGVYGCGLFLWRRFVRGRRRH